MAGTSSSPDSVLISSFVSTFNWSYLCTNKMLMARHKTSYTNLKARWWNKKAALGFFCSDCLRYAWPLVYLARLKTNSKKFLFKKYQLWQLAAICCKRRNSMQIASRFDVRRLKDNKAVNSSSQRTCLTFWAHVEWVCSVSVLNMETIWKLLGL